MSWSDGKLGLKPYGDLSARCEIELSGRRRKSEMIHLESPAPSGLRLLWESVDEVASWSWEPSFQLRFKERAVELVDQSLRSTGRSPKWLLGLLHWAESVSDLRPYPELAQSPIFAGVDGGWFSFQQLERLEFIPVLGDRSASIPAELPYPVLLWEDSVLDRLGFTTRDVAAEVRAAYFKEQGRQRWLSRHRPSKAEEWSSVRDFIRLARADGHLVFQVEGPSRVVIWREGRPLGREWTLDDAEPGKLLIFQDDQFPADAYWSRPDQEALAKNRELFIAILDSSPPL